MNEKNHKISEPFKAINLACGDKLCYQSGWINADHSPVSKGVIKMNLLQPIPYSDNTFDVVYNSQFIEHLTLNMGLNFLQECKRVLKPNGILRIVTPDLRNQAKEYLNKLNDILDSPDDEVAKLHYSWIRTEMLDQLNRNASGGDMVKILDGSGADLSDYLWQRLGRSGKNLILKEEKKEIKSPLNKALRYTKNLICNTINRLTPELIRVGKFRLSGEVHLCMYDEYLLMDLLKQAGFCLVSKLSVKESKIHNWDLTELDCDKQGFLDAPASLFMEAQKGDDNA
jgi:predicted SAM-dependent methyltransferase